MPTGYASACLMFCKRAEAGARLAPPPQPAGSRGSDAEHDLLSSAWHADRGSAVRPCTAPERPATVLANAAACPLPKLGLGKRESANGVLPAARRTTRRCRPRCRPYTRTGLRAIVEPPPALDAAP